MEHDHRAWWSRDHAPIVEKLSWINSGVESDREFPAAGKVW